MVDFIRKIRKILAHLTTNCGIVFFGDFHLNEYFMSRNKDLYLKNVGSSKSNCANYIGFFISYSANCRYFSEWQSFIDNKLCKNKKKICFDELWRHLNKTDCEILCIFMTSWYQCTLSEFIIIWIKFHS